MSGPRRATRSDGTPSLALGYLAALPLLAAYEVALAVQDTGAARASAERVLARLLALFGAHASLVRIGLLAALALSAYVARRRAGDRGRPLVAQLAALAGVGALAGVLLGPLLAALAAWLEAGRLGVAPERARGLVAMLRLAGAAPWEELLFRVGVYGGLFLLVRRTSGFLGLESRVSQGAAELAALLASAVLFAWFHLDAVQRLLGSPGEAYHRGLFLWRVSAGILLGALFRWRGLGVAAWAHAVFNLGLALNLRA